MSSFFFLTVITQRFPRLKLIKKYKKTPRNSDINKITKFLNSNKKSNKVSGRSDPPSTYVCLGGNEVKEERRCRVGASPPSVINFRLPGRLWGYAGPSYLHRRGLSTVKRCCFLFSPRRTGRAIKIPRNFRDFVTYGLAGL